MATGGRLNRQQAAFAGEMARTGDATYSAAKAGYTSPQQRASQNLAVPAVQSEIARRQQEMLFSEILPLAVAVHKRLLTDAKTPAGAQVQAIKLAYDRTLGMDGAGQAKEPHEMTGEELATAISALERVAAARAHDVTPESPAEPSVFD